MMNLDLDDLDLTAPCAGGAERALFFELRDLGATHIKRGRGAVRFRAPASLIPTLNIQLRTAHRVLVVLTSLDARTPEQLTDHLLSFPFENILDTQTTFAVRANLLNAPWNHTHYAALRVKDCIVDRMRDHGPGRPDVDTKRPDVRFVLHWSHQQASLSIDTSGVSLHRRGYRPRDATSPIRESFAASILAVGHADTSRPFHDPCCGSGTLAIEQAWRALKIPPGLGKYFAFQRWKRGPLSAVSRSLPQSLSDAKDARLSSLPAPITLADHSPRACDNAREAIQRASLSQHLDVRREDARVMRLEGHRPVVFSNLPYGERMGKQRLQLQGFYRGLGERLSTLNGARIVLLCGDDNLARLFNLGDGRVWPLRNGPIDVRLHRWDLPLIEDDEDTDDDDELHDQNTLDDDA